MNYKIVTPAIFACLLWSTAFAGIKVGLQYCDPFTFAGIRFMLSGILLLPFWFYKKRSFIRIIRNWKIVFLVSFFQTYVLYVLMFWALKYVSGTITAIIVGSSPLITAFTTHIMTSNDKIERNKLFSILVGVVGITLITFHRWETSMEGNTFIFGVILLVISCISSAVGNIIVSTRRSLTSPVTLNSIQMFLGGVLLFFTGIFVNGSPNLPANPKFYIALIWLSFISACAFSVWFILLKTKNIKVSDLNVWKFIVPIFGAIFSWIIIPGEHPETITIIGMFIAAGSILMYNMSAKKKNLF